MKGLQPPDSTAGLIDAWWNAVLAGQADEAHPVHGDDLNVLIKQGVLHLSGQVASKADIDELLTKARGYVGRGVDKIDATHLKVLKRKEKPGILDQTLIAAFPNRDVAELARKFLVDIRRVRPKQLEILEPGQEEKARLLLPKDFADDVSQAFKAGQAILVLRLDETDAFKVREMLAEDTRSVWTVSTPPAVAASGGH